MTTEGPSFRCFPFSITTLPNGSNITVQHIPVDLVGRKRDVAHWGSERLPAQEKSVRIFVLLCTEVGAVVEVY